LQQARDTRLPAVSIHRRLRVLVEDDLDRLFPEGVRLTAHPDAARTITGALQNRGDRRVLLAVGPEGGWNGFELELLAAHGFEDVGIGPRTLRSDTACVALIAMVNEVLR
jgi:RsmE family RNA methyltransferase